MNRILVWGLSNKRAGTELVISTYASIARDTQFDFLGYDEPLSFGELVQGTGNRFFVIPPKGKNPIAYYVALNRFMRAHAKEYNALWFNLNNMANIDLLVYAKRYGIQRRIVHSHNSSAPHEPILRLFSAANAARCRRLATDRWACSAVAGNYAFGNEAYDIIPNLIDAKRCSFSESKRLEVRKRYGLTSQKVIGTIGRLCEQKNPVFLLKVFSKALRHDSSLRLVYVGEGELRDALEAQANELEIADKVVFAGSQPDIQGFLSAFDVFAFPSLFEGLPLALLEAQFNGLPCLVSNAISEDAIISGNAHSMSLNKENEWINGLLYSSRLVDSLIAERSDLYDLDKAAPSASRLFLANRECWD